jgi:uncharacterized delta-60 repeat protein
MMTVKRNRNMLPAVALGAACWLSSEHAFAVSVWGRVARYTANGNLDTTFGGGDGVAAIPPPSGFSGIEFTSVQKNSVGQYVLAARVIGTNDTRAAITIVGPTGDLVATYMAGGPALVSNVELEIAPDGRMFIGGTDHFSGAAFVRSTVDGTSWNVGSTAIPYVPSWSSLSRCPDGKIILGFSATAPSGFIGYMIRFRSDLLVDTTFGSNGVVAGNFGNGGVQTTFRETLCIGQVYFAGASYTAAGETRFLLGRLNSNGSLDNSFDGNGTITTNFTGTPSETITALYRDPVSGVITAVGDGQASDGSGRLTMARYDVSGALDPSFSSDGKQQLNLPGIHEYFFALSGGLFYRLAGRAASGEALIAQVSMAGSLNNQFSGDGWATLNSGWHHDVLTDAGLSVAVGACTGSVCGQ